MEKAKVQLDEQKLSGALDTVNEELKKNPSSVDALLLRSTIYTRTSQLEPALRDAERAVSLSNGSGESQLRRAICLWRLKRVGEAKSLVKFFGSGPQVDTWKQLIEHDTSPAIEVPRIPTVVNKEASSTASSATAKTSQPAPSQGPPAAPKVDCYQSAQTVHVVLYRKGLDPSTKVSIEPQSLAVDSDPDSFHWSVDLDKEIDAANSSYDLTKFKVEFTLKKLTNESWDSFIGTKMGSSTSAPSAKPQPSSTLTSYSKWESLEDEPAEDESDPMHFFQNIYKNAPPETQRAMMKSYIESNGTALSTNWEEVSKGKVETHPPKDMEAKQW